MTVRSGVTNQELQDSGTNSQGDFVMELASSESSLAIDVDGVGGPIIQLQQQGSGCITTKLAVTNQGTLSASDLFEAQVVSASLCDGLVAEGTQVVIVGDILGGPCLVPIQNIERLEKLDPNFKANLQATCDNPHCVETLLD